MKKWKRTILTVQFSLLSFLSREALAGGIPVFDGSNLAQNILEATRALRSNLNEARMIQHQVQSLQNEFRNLTKLDFNILDDYSQSLTRLFEQMGSVHGLMQNLSTLEARFDELYPEFNNEPEQVELERASEAMNEALDESRRMMLGAAKTGAQVLENLPQSEAHLEELLASSSSSVGILQATQAGNQINAEVASNLQHLNAMLANYVQAHMAYMQRQNTEEALEINWAAASKNAQIPAEVEPVPMRPF